MNVPTFLATYPEFSGIDPDMVTPFLARATTRLDPTVWGTRLEEGIGLLTAHLLALSPAGQMARLVSEKGKTTYGTEFATLCRVVSIAIRVT